MAPNASAELMLHATAKIPGQTRGPASRAWLYYTPNARRWAEPLLVDVKPR